MRKSPDAFRTISEVAQDLDLPQHVLRFWETRFSQIKPMKRGGGRRYYRPDDVELLRGIRHLLYDEGYTIKGVQRILKEQGVRHVIDSVEDGGLNANQPEMAHAGPDDSAYSEPHQLETQRPPLVTPQTPPHAPPSQHHVNAQPQVNVANVPTQSVPVHATPATAPVQTHQFQPQIQAPSHPQIVPAMRGPVHGVSTQVSHGQAAVARHYDHPDADADIAVEQRAPMKPEAPVKAPETRFSPEQVEREEDALASQARPSEPKAEAHDAGSPKDLSHGDPKYLRGQDASYSVESGRSKYWEEEPRSGLFSRLRGRADGHDGESRGDGKGLSRDEVRRLQATLFEMLECKRILDQARSE